MILSCQNISKSFGTDEILKNVSFHIEENEKAAVVGINGAGKSTLLKIIMKQENPDEGEVTLAKDKTIGYLAQYQDVSGHHTIYEEVLDSKRDIIEMEERLRDMETQMNTLSGEALEQLLDTYHKLSHEFEQVNGYAYRSEVTGILKGLGFTAEEFDKKMSELSGGQKTRVSLGKLLVTKPDILLLDEPTNHLDIESIRWLETFLMNYKGAVLIVSHDRYFLDRVVSKVVEIFQHKGYVYQGNYSDYAKKKAAIRAAMIKQYYNQQREIRHQEEVIAKLKSFNREKSIKRAESREKLLDKIERIEKPTEDNTDIRIVLEPNVVSGNDVLKVEGLAKAFPPLQLFSGINFEVKRGERVALIGNNGTGKSTFIKILMGQVKPDSGTVDVGETVRFGYYSQDGLQFDEQMKVIDVVQDIAEVIELGNGKKLTASQFLQHFLFTPETQHSYVYKLSGGERRRLYLCTVLMRNPNFLVLDEPTNDLDIITLNVLEEYLQNFKGCVIVVSHDRYFMDKVVDHLMVFNGQGDIRDFPGNYSDYRDWKEAKAQKEKEAEKPQEEKTARVRLNDKRKMSFKEKREFEQLEKEIAELEAEKAQIEELLCSGTLSVDELTEKSKRLPEVNDLIDEKTMRWLELSEIEG